MEKKFDLEGIAPEIREYIGFLEEEIVRLRKLTQTLEGNLPSQEQDNDSTPELPTSVNVITFTANAVAKRTPRHFYSKQRRGGMGVFDLDAPSEDPPFLLSVADENQNLLLFTNLGRVFRLSVALIEPSEIRARGKSLTGKISIQPNERLTAIIPDQARGSIAFVTQKGYVRTFRHHIFGEYMRPGTSLLDSQKYGEVSSASWTPGNGDLFIATHQGKAIRFSEKLIPPQGIQGIRLEADDYPVAITYVDDESAVFLFDSQGNGTLRLMSGFSANKSAGGGGKIAMKTQVLVSAFNINQSSDIFLISNLSKIIRFGIDEVPGKEDPVQGVRCMDLRADFVVAGSCN